MKYFNTTVSKHYSNRTFIALLGNLVSRSQTLFLRKLWNWVWELDDRKVMLTTNL